MEEKSSRVENYVDQYLKLLEKDVEVHKGPPVGEINIAESLCVIVVTSAISIHPDTSMIEAVFATHIKVEPSLYDCEKIIVCDKPKVILLVVFIDRLLKEI